MSRYARPLWNGVSRLVNEMSTIQRLRTTLARAYPVSLHFGAWLLLGFDTIGHVWPGTTLAEDCYVTIRRGINSTLSHVLLL